MFEFIGFLSVFIFAVFHIISYTFLLTSVLDLLKAGDELHMEVYRLKGQLKIMKRKMAKRDSTELTSNTGNDL